MKKYKIEIIERNVYEMEVIADDDYFAKQLAMANYYKPNSGSKQIENDIDIVILSVK